jgi:hypothetical protein
MKFALPRALPRPKAEGNRAIHPAQHLVFRIHVSGRPLDALARYYT